MGEGTLISSPYRAHGIEQVMPERRFHGMRTWTFTIVTLITSIHFAVPFVRAEEDKPLLAIRGPLLFQDDFERAISETHGRPMTRPVACPASRRSSREHSP